MERWKQKRIDAGLPAWPKKKRAEEQRKRATELARKRYKPRIKEGKPDKSPDERWVHKALISARHRAKKRGLDFDLVADDLIIPEYCPILGIRLEVNNGRATRKNGNSPSLDRIANEHGYIKGNVRIISARANQLKSDATIDEISAILQDMCSNANRHTLNLEYTND